MKNEITIGGETIEIHHPTVALVSSILPTLVPILEAAQIDGESNWLRALEANTDRLTTCISVAVGKPKEWVENLTFDEFVELSVALFETYASYLRRVAMPKLQIVKPINEG